MTKMYHYNFINLYDMLRKLFGIEKKKSNENTNLDVFYSLIFLALFYYQLINDIHISNSARN